MAAFAPITYANHPHRLPLSLPQLFSRSFGSTVLDGVAVNLTAVDTAGSAAIS